MFKAIVIASLIFIAINMGWLTGTQALWALGIGAGLLVAMIGIYLVIAWYASKG